VLEMHNLRGFYDVRHHTSDTQGKHIIHVSHVHIIPSVSSVRRKRIFKQAGAGGKPRPGDRNPDI